MIGPRGGVRRSDPRLEVVMFDDRQTTMNERKYRETTALLNKNLELRVTDREQLEQLLAAVNREIESILAALARLDRATIV